MSVFVGVFLLFVASVLATASQETDVGNTEDVEDETEYDPHSHVLTWLRNRAEYTEETQFKRPYQNKKEDDDYQYQNGYFFAQKKLRVLTGFNGNTKLDGEDSSDNDETFQVRIVATTDIPKGELLVGVPSSAFVYSQDYPTYKMLHPCDVTSKLLSASTYRYPANGEEEGRGFRALVGFIRPLIDSVLAITRLPEEDILQTKDRHLWSVDQLDSLTSILGNELAPKANTLALWGDDPTTTEKELPLLCQHPNPHDRENNKITDHFFDPANPRKEMLQRLFRATLALVVTRSWDNRMVPIYHWIRRSDDNYNVVHSERIIDVHAVKPKFADWNTHLSSEVPSVYELHAARDISKGEELILHYHSVAQEFATEGKIARKDEDEGTHYRFWTQTLHEQLGYDLVYSKIEDDPYDSWLSWDYFPKTQTIRWIKNPWDPFLEHNTLRSTQRSVLQAQYLRLRSMEKDVKELLAANPNDAGNTAIAEYYDLWAESLGVLLANARPDRDVPVHQKCDVYTDATSCVAPGGQSNKSLNYDDLREHEFGIDPIDYNNYVASHECGSRFKQSTYERNDTPYAQLEWSRSYIGGGAISDHYGDEETMAADEREQDTCLWLENVIHSCLSFRPHVHETLIHYPASFLPKGGMKRIMYVGGGDLVLLHELLRYESVELIIGMELDQVVLRNSFRHYGIQPKFEDERVHWWFGDAAKSLSLLPLEEYFGTFDMVLIDLVAEIFDLLRVGEHNERLVDYLAKLVKPEGILVRQEDWPTHNLVDFAKYTVDLNVFGMPHTCSQYFTMASNAIDFANHDRVDHELKDLVWYEPNIESHDHTKMWTAYRNNLEPPERICNSTEKQMTHVLPSKGLFVAIEAENLSVNLGDLTLVKDAIMNALESVGFSKIDHHDIMVDQPAVFHYMMFIFDGGFLMIRSFPEQKFASMDLQLWNNFSKQEKAVSALIEAVGGDVSSDSSSTFFITTGGMFGISNMDEYSTPIVPSVWCEKDSEDDISDPEQSTIRGLEVVTEEILTSFVGKNDDEYIVLLLCASDSSTCKSTANFGLYAKVLTFNECSSLLENGSEKAMKECEDKMRETIEEALIDSETKIRAIIIDPEASKELGQITNKLFVKESSSYKWLSHDFIVLAPSASKAATAGSGYSSSWRYQLLDRFRTDMIEFNPVFHATLSFPGASSSSSEWTMGVLSAGNPLFYGLLKDSMNAIKKSPATEIEEVVLVETKTGAISHIPDYEPSKWALPSDYDIKPAEKQYSEQKPVGVQLLVQHELNAEVDMDVEVGDKVLMFIEEDNLWCTAIVERITEDDYGDILFSVRSQGRGERRTLDFGDICPFDYDDETQNNATIPFGTPVLADGREDDVDERYFHKAQIVGFREDGRYRVYYLSDGSFGYLKPNEVATTPFGFFKSPEDAKMYPSCEEFFELVRDRSRESVVRMEIGDGCMAVLTWPRPNNEITTMVATYDGQIHLDFNVYSSAGLYEKNEDRSLVTVLADRDIQDTDKTQTDFFPRGYGRVVNFRHDLDKTYFGTKYPDTLMDITDFEL